MPEAHAQAVHYSVPVQEIYGYPAIFVSQFWDQRKRARPTDPACVVTRRCPDGRFREVRRYNRWVKPLAKGDKGPVPMVDTYRPEFEVLPGR